MPVHLGALVRRELAVEEVDDRLFRRAVGHGGRDRITRKRRDVRNPVSPPPLQDVIDRARAAWPELELDEAGFAAHVARHLEGGDAAALHAGDLWLAYGCSVGDADAVAAFDREVLSQVGCCSGACSRRRS